MKKAAEETRNKAEAQMNAALRKGLKSRYDKVDEGRTARPPRDHQTERQARTYRTALGGIVFHQSPSSALR